MVFLPSLARPIAMAYVDLEHSFEGNALEIEVFEVSGLAQSYALHLLFLTVITEELIDGTLLY